MTQNLISNIYGIASTGSLRGKATEGFIRPTIAEFFTSKNFEETPNIVPATIPLTETAGGLHSISPDGLTISKLVSNGLFTYSFLDAPISSGKHYFEATFNGVLGDIIVVDDFESTRSTDGSTAGAYRSDSWGAYSHAGQMYEGTTSVGSLSGGEYKSEVMGIALDMDNKTMMFWQGSDTGTVGIHGTSLPSTVYVAFAIAVISSINVNFGQSTFSFAVPSGYTAGLLI